MGICKHEVWIWEYDNYVRCAGCGMIVKSDEIDKKRAKSKEQKKDSG